MGRAGLHSAVRFRARPGHRGRGPGADLSGHAGGELAPGGRLTIADLFWRTAYRIGFPLARLWWRLRRASHEGALVAIWVGDAVLLVRSSYRAEWNLPGGGVWPGETPEGAARRELMEELGLSAGALVSARIVSGQFEGRRDRVHFFVWRVETLPVLRIDNREIVGARLVPRAQLAGLALTVPVRGFLAADAG